MCSDMAIALSGVSKSYPIYQKPHHRLLQMVAREKTRWFREFHALRGVDLAVGRGETVGIVGRNGSGKSTLLQIICGTLAPNAGVVRVNGRVAALLELGAGFNPEFTGRENVSLNASILGLTEAQISERFDEIEAFADIGEFIDQPVKTYSSGMYVRLAFAVAINVQPEILVIDEALSVGDEGFQRKCYARIDAIRDAGATVLFVSHSAGAVVDLCDRAVLLDQGELIAEGTPKHVVSQYQRLLHTPADRTRAVRGEIQSMPRDGSSTATIQRGGQAEAAVVRRPDAYWDAGLVPPATVEYENRGAEVIDPHLQTLDGKRVNVIVPGESYAYAYGVRITRTVAGVCCGMMIRTLTGIDLGGCATARGIEEMELVTAGTELEVRLRFRCLLAPGTYFLNAGVKGRFGEGEEIVNRWVDVAMFRVMQIPDAVATGLVDFDFVPQVRVLA